MDIIFFRIQPGCAKYICWHQTGVKALQSFPAPLLLVAPLIVHEIWLELRKFFQDIDKRSTSGADANLVTDALNFELYVSSLVGKLGWNPNRLRIPNSENFCGSHVILMCGRECTMP
jgi:hypothetical protein